MAIDENDNPSMQKLLDRQQDLKKKLIQAHRAGMSGQIVGQIQSMIESVEFEIYNTSELDKLKQTPTDDDDFIIG
tara:strand:- start:5849 stop:6073 length:225 start_codon:yes stop_codon:yes gene_type:complete